jgi:hypothetical protein
MLTWAWLYSPYQIGGSMVFKRKVVKSEEVKEVKENDNVIYDPNEVLATEE